MDLLGRDFSPRSLLQRFLARSGIRGAKIGYNPNSSSLGVDVTFLLFGLSTITLLTPVLSLLVRGAARPAGSDPSA
jgi:hypothetical protein